MRVPSTPRRTGARGKPVHFTYVSVEKGPTWEAYLAGPTWWGYLHMTKPSKPCVYELTNRELACRYCTPGKTCIPVVKGWVPLYRRVDGFACMVPVDESLRDTIDAMKSFTKVVVGRAKGKGAQAFVQPCMNQEPEWSSTIPERKVEADVTTTLLTVWGTPELVSYFRESSDNAMSLAIERTAKKVFEGTNEGAGEAPPPPPPADPLDANAVFVASVNRLTGRSANGKPSANGQH